jgi:hypothetical protein
VLLAEIHSAVYQRSLSLMTKNLPIVVMSELEDVVDVVGASAMTAKGGAFIRGPVAAPPVTDRALREGRSEKQVRARVL